MEKFNYFIFFAFGIIKKPTLKIYQRITSIMLYILNKLNIIGFNSIEKLSYFISFAFGIIKKPTLKIYQNMIKLVKPPPNILTDPIFKNKLFCQTDKQFDEKRVFKNFIVKSSLIGTSIRLFFSNILSIVILSVHLMFRKLLIGHCPKQGRNYQHSWDLLIIIEIFYQVSRMLRLN